MKRVIVPFFIAHQGCPHQCVFCDQHTLTGQAGALPQPAEILGSIAAWCASSRTESVEVAFYGGTFTALPLEQQQRLLEPLQPLLAAGRVRAVRVSTRPDAVSETIAAMLRAAGVTLVELGVQSLHDHVLAAAGRGHSAADTLSAFTLLRAAGLQIGAQLMPGLPGESATEALDSFRRVMALKPDLLRIYPTVVLRGTELEQLYLQGRYQPLSLAAAVSLCKIMLQEAARAGIPVIRAGLQPTGDLAVGAQIVAGPYHPAFRQLAEAERWYDLLQQLTAVFERGAALTVHAPPARIADIVGQKRGNLVRLTAQTGREIMGVRGDADLAPGAIRITDGRRSISGEILRDLSYEVSL